MPDRSESMHCTHCGAAHTDRGWPKTCPGCGEVSYKNPIPVAVALVPVRGEAGGDGLLAIRRDIEPQKGELALPGGYVDHAETWQEALVREVREETEVQLDPGGVQVFDVLSAPSGPVLIFGRTAAVAEADLPPFTRTNETSERAVIREARDMAFPLHTQVVRAFFERG
jgi:ADP-ribose pyrophosphatase YjhB (NUDIX family)